MPMDNFVAIAGATGAMGNLIATELRKRNVNVKALVRPGSSASKLDSLSKLGDGVAIAEVDMADVPALTRELTGARAVVSTLQGLSDVVLTTQGKLLDAAVAAKVPRFIPSDYALDFTKTKPGSNRNLDLRRQFHARLEASGIAWTSVLNGAFMEMMLPPISMVDRDKRKVMYAGSADQKLDFTTMADTAAFTAAVAADPSPTPKYLRIAGEVISPRELALAATRADSEATGAAAAAAAAAAAKPFRPFWIGSVWFLEFIIPIIRFFTGGEDQLLPAWQGMQYMANMMSGKGKLEPLDNDRYQGLKWTKAEDFLREHYNSDKAN